MTSRLRFFTAACLLSLMAPVARSGVPSAANSTFPPCLVICPMGDLPFDVTVRDLANNPNAGSTVVLDLSLCPGAFVCTCCAPDPYIWDPTTRTVRMVADANGRVSVPLRIGGTCGSGGVRLYADGVFFASYALASPDQDGDGQVIFLVWNVWIDWPLFSGKLGTSDPTADFDCTGTVDYDDQAIMGHHGSHSCWGYVDPTTRRSWGQVKLRYR